jgi:pimeloyl-ACP methyl ester carboxylesterase
MVKQYRDVIVVVALIAVSTVLMGCESAKSKVAEKATAGAAINEFISIKPDNDIGKQINMDCDPEQNIAMSNITHNIWWPTCGELKSLDDVAKCKDTCFSPDLIKEMHAFNKKHGGKLVTYKSRSGKDSEGKDLEVVNLRGWWLPAPDAKEDTPRIVVQHGFKGNSNKVRPQVAAYRLRKLGYSVLVNNLRDHCYSDPSKEGLIGWGHAYPLDTLGAWDFLKDEAAEPIDASKVGILGFSMGGFATANAFGMEDKVPAIWLDGAPFTPKDGFEAAFARGVGDMAGGKVKEAAGETLGSAASNLGEWAGGHLSDATWKHVEKEAASKGADLNSHVPEEQLLKGPDAARPVFVTANKHDDTVPISSTQKYVDLFKKNSDKYDLKSFWTQDKVCGDQGGHCLGHLMYNEEYEHKLCKFWSSAFGTNASCGASAEASKSGSAADTKEEAVGNKDTKLFEMDHWSFRSASPNMPVVVLASFMAVVAAVGLVALGRRMAAKRTPMNEADQENLIPSTE